MNFKNRREQLSTKIDNNSVAIILAGEPVRRSADSEYEYEAHRNYYYLTGLNEPEGILLMTKINHEVKETLFIRDINPDMEKWIGRFIQPSKAKEISQIEDIRFVSQFENIFQMMLSRQGTNKVYLDLDRQKMNTRPLDSELFLEKLRKSYPALSIENLNAHINRLRSIKDEEEIEAIKAACELTNQAIEFAVKNMKPGMYEYEIMADFLYILNKSNAIEGFDTIMASGSNGPILHYVENNSVTKEGDLILFDLGAKLNHYSADISRTYPMSGKFTERQRELMNIVLEAMDKVTEAAKPGVTLVELNQIVINHYQERLMEIGLISHPSEVSKYYYHSVSHFLGLDTHDVGQITHEPLQPGHVITNEPGLYIQEENIGIRIETDLLITEDGCIDLAPQIKKTPDEIEALMNR